VLREGREVSEGAGARPISFFAVFAAFARPSKTRHHRLPVVNLENQVIGFSTDIMPRLRNLSHFFFSRRRAISRSVVKLFVVSMLQEPSTNCSVAIVLPSRNCEKVIVSTVVQPLSRWER